MFVEDGSNAYLRCDRPTSRRCGQRCAHCPSRDVGAERSDPVGGGVMKTASIRGEDRRVPRRPLRRQLNLDQFLGAAADGYAVCLVAADVLRALVPPPTRTPH